MRNEKSRKKVEISQELFIDLIKYHCIEDNPKNEKICQALEEKMDRLVRRELYTRSLTAPTEEEREAARKEYLDKKGVPAAFRW